jgi:iron complex transport system substrate-binding protein
MIFIALAWVTGACVSRPEAPAQITASPASITPTALSPTREPSQTPAPTSTEAPASEPISITDGLDRPVVLPAPAQRIVSMAPSNTEILFAIGGDSQVIGRDEFSDYPEEAKALPGVGGGFSDYNLEAIVELRPELVLAAEINTAEQVQALEDLGLTVFYLANPTTLEELYANLGTVGRLIGREDEATEVVQGLEARVAEVESRVASATERPTVFYELDGTDPAAPWTAGTDTFIDILIQLAGGENIASDIGSGYIQVSVEELLVRNPDLILLGDSAYGATPELVAERAGWDALISVQNNSIYPFDDNLVSRPGPRLVDGLEELAKLLHPELFGE